MNDYKEAVKKLQIKTVTYSDDICSILKDKKEVKIYTRNTNIGKINYENVIEESFVLTFLDKDDNIVAEINKHYIDYYDKVNNALVFNKFI